MKLRAFSLLLWLLLPRLVGAQGEARVERFSPQGTVKRVAQARALFSEPMVPLGDPRAAPEPFEIDCPEKGSGRWVDSRNWVYDFERDLPAGLRCEFMSPIQTSPIMEYELAASDYVVQGSKALRLEIKP